MTTRPEIPPQDGWAVEMHGECVLFCSNGEKAAGSSPGARVRVFSEAKLRAYADAYVAAEISRLQAQLAESMQQSDALLARGLEYCDKIDVLQAQVDALADALVSAVEAIDLVEDSILGVKRNMAPDDDGFYFDQIHKDEMDCLTSAKKQGEAALNAAGR